MRQEVSRSGVSGDRRIAGLLPDVSGQDLAEYAILIGGIAVVVIGAVTVLGQDLLAFFQGALDDLPF